MTNFLWNTQEIEKRLLERATLTESTGASALPPTASAVHEADIVYLFFKEIRSALSRSQQSTNGMFQKTSQSLLQEIPQLWEDYKHQLPQHLKQKAENADSFVVVSLPQNYTKKQMRYAAFKVQLIEFAIASEGKNTTWDARSFEYPGINVNNKTHRFYVYASPDKNHRDGFYKTLAQAPYNKTWKQLKQKSPYKKKPGSETYELDPDYRTEDMSIFLSHLVTQFKQDFLAWIGSDPKLKEYIDRLSIPYDQLITSILLMYAHLFTPTNVSPEDSLLRATRVVLDPLTTWFCQVKAENTSTIEATLADCCDKAQENLSQGISNFLPSEKKFLPQPSGELTQTMRNLRTDPNDKWSKLGSLTAATLLHELPENCYKNLDSKNTTLSQFLNHLLQVNQSFLDQVPSHCTLELRQAMMRRLWKAVASDNRLPASFQSISSAQWLKALEEAAQANNNQLLLMVSASFPAEYQASGKVIVQRRYETALIDALNNQTNIPNYFDDARIEQYFLDQITEFEKSGKLGGADAMRSILNSALPLHTKLHMLAAIGKGKSNNAFLSLSRMGRRKEVREFYKNLRVFEDLASPDEVHKTFENFLRNSKKVSSKIENIEHHIQRYTLLRLGLQGIQLTPKDKASLARFLNRYCTKSLSDRPLKVLNEIEWTQKFLNLEKPAIQNAIASPKNTGNYTQPFSQWIQFAIATQTSPTLEDLLLIGVRPTTGQLVECCKLVHNAQKKLGDEAASIFIRALAKTTLSAEKETKTQLVQALSQALRNHQPGAQAVLNEMFYQAALHNDSKILVDLANNMSSFYSPEQTVTSDDQRIRQALLSQAKSLGKNSSEINKYCGGIFASCYQSSPINDTTITTIILESNLPLSQQLHILSAVCKGKIQKESHRLIRRSSKTFYTHLQALLDAVKIELPSLYSNSKTFENNASWNINAKTSITRTESDTTSQADQSSELFDTHDNPGNRKNSTHLLDKPDTPITSSTWFSMWGNSKTASVWEKSLGDILRCSSVI